MTDADKYVEMGPPRYRPNGGQSIAVVAPERCPAGHLLDYPNVAVRGTVRDLCYTCETCYRAGVRPHTLRYTYPER